MGKELHWNRKLNNRSIKRIFSFVLAFVLCFSMFSNSSFTSHAQGKYTRTKFAFDFSAYASSWSDTFKETFASADFQYLYAFHFHDQYLFDFFSGIGSSWKAPRIMVDSTNTYSCPVNTEGYYFLFTTSPLVANYQYDTDVPVVTLGFGDSNPNKVFCVYIKGGSAVAYNGWSFYGHTSLPDFGLRMVYGSAPNDIVKYTYFNPYYCDVMSNVDLCQYNNKDEILWEKCLSDDVLTTFKNTSTGIDSGSGSGGSGSGSSGSGSSSGGTLVDTGDLVEYDDTLGSLFHNISVIAQRIINLPYYISQSIADRLGLGSLFDSVVSRITTVGGYVLSLPSDIADKLGLDVHIANVLTKLSSINTSIGSLAEKWAQLPIEIGKALGTDEFFTSVLKEWESLGIRMLSLPASIADALGVDDLFSSLALLPYNMAVEIFKNGSLKDVLDHMLNIPINVGKQIGIILNEMGLYGIVELPLKIGEVLADVFKEFGLDGFIEFPLKIGSQIKENLESDTVWNKFKEALIMLFVPTEGVLGDYIDEFMSRFPFIEEASKGFNYIIDQLNLVDYSKSPVIDFNFSSSSLAKYGVGDLTVDFSWFAPYRSYVLGVEKAFLYGVFIVRQFFGLKNMINTSDSAFTITSSLEGW